MRASRLGIWDISRGGLSLGGLLIFVAELSATFKGESFDLCLLDPSSSIRDLCDSPTPNSIGQIRIGGHPTLNAIALLQNVDRILYSTSIDELRNIKNVSTWPNLANLDQHRQISTLQLQELFKSGIPIPPLRFIDAQRRKNKEFLKENLRARLPIVVHLKNSTQDPLSNAKQDIWCAFFSEMLSREEFYFLLIGNEEISANILELPNTLSTSNHHLSLCDELSLIELAYAFMGMAAGPCQMAIFGSNPYRIYKHPDHHKEEMNEELGDKNFLPFARANQKIIRQFETTQGLIEGLNEIDCKTEAINWRDRFCDE